jgi:hypothetical protein
MSQAHASTRSSVSVRLAVLLEPRVALLVSSTAAGMAGLVIWLRRSEGAGHSA